MKKKTGKSQKKSSGRKKTSSTEKSSKKYNFGKLSILSASLFGLGRSASQNADHVSSDLDPLLDQSNYHFT